MSSGICYLLSLDYRCTDFELQELQTSTNQNQTMKYVTFIITPIEQITLLQQNNKFMNLKASKKQHLNIIRVFLPPLLILFFKQYLTDCSIFIIKGSKK